MELKEHELGGSGDQGGYDQKICFSQMKMLPLISMIVRDDPPSLMLRI